MKKHLKLILIFLGVLIILLLGFFLWSKNHPQATVPNRASSPTPTSYPKVEKFEVPILMYHYIRIAPENDQLGANLSVSPQNFASQIKYLHDDNYSTVKLADLADPNLSEISKVYYLKKKPIVITFDDGYDNAYTEAFPVLKQNGFIGTFFIIKDYTGREGRLTDSQINEMAKAGMEFGSHTLTHPDLTKISFDDAKNQIFDSKGDWLVFCYPSGKFNDEVVSLVREAGYKVAVTTKIGIAKDTSNLLQLPRVRIENVDTQAFADKISYAYEHGM